jgi:hypothetical protein
MSFGDANTRVIVLNFSANGLGVLGHNQLEWLEANLKGRSASIPIVVFGHMPILSLAESTLA